MQKKKKEKKKYIAKGSQGVLTLCMCSCANALLAIHPSEQLNARILGHMQAVKHPDPRVKKLKKTYICIDVNMHVRENVCMHICTDVNM